MRCVLANPSPGGTQSCEIEALTGTSAGASEESEEEESEDELDAEELDESLEEESEDEALLLLEELSEDDDEGDNDEEDEDEDELVEASDGRLLLCCTTAFLVLEFISLFLSSNAFKADAAPNDVIGGSDIDTEEGGPAVIVLLAMGGLGQAGSFFSSSF